MQRNKPLIHCDALVVHCMGYRLQKFLQPWITARFGYDNFDIISLAGGVHDYEMVLKMRRNPSSAKVKRFDSTTCSCCRLKP